MTNTADTRKELERWKDKYFEQSESFESHKNRAQDYAALLQRILVRVSLAAENVSSKLDQELSSLRTAIRQATPESNDLDERLKRIDQLILASDESKQQSSGKIVQILDQLIEQLMTLDLPRKQKNTLKKLSKSFTKKTLNLQEFPGILSEYAALQAQVLKEVYRETGQTQGFFSRFLKSAKRPDIDVLSTTSGQPEADELEIATHESPSEAEEVLPGFSSVARHIRQTLNNLLDQLSFPASAERDLLKLREQIDKELVWYELGPTLDDVVNLVLSVVGKGQREFESFLKVLDERLSKVQGFLRDSQVAEAGWQTKNEAFDQTVRDQVGEISQKMDQSNDLDELKRSISEHLDAIYQAVDQHEGDGKQFASDREQEIKILQERVQLMEQESVYMHQRLKEERQKALRDALTALPNREAYDERFELELERWKRYEKPAVLVVADIDLFKRINDEYGHLSGDKVLQIIAKELSSRVRKTDFVARYGGEEFVLLLPETDLKTAHQVIEKVREMVGRLPFHFRDEQIQITMSFGLIEFKDGCAGKEANDIQQRILFERADEALYRAKENGRNRVELWSATE